MAYITISDKDIAMLEHEFIGKQEILEWKAEDAQFYLMGMYEFACALIEKIRETEKNT